MMRIQRGVLWAAVVVAAGCSSSLATPPGGTGGLGAGGASGEGGVPTTGGAGTGGLAGDGGAGTSGLAGAGGIGGGGGWAGSGGGILSTGGVGGAVLPICAPASGAADGGLGGAAAVDVESCAYDADNNPVFTTVSAAVTVVSVDQVPAGNCSFLGLPFSTASSPPSSKVVLETAEQQRWTVYLRIPNMPANTIQVGDSFDLAIDGKSSLSGFFFPAEQMVSLGKSGQTVVFGCGNGPPNSMHPAGITFQLGPATCQDPPIFAGCYGFAHYPMNITYGADTAVVQEGETRQVGGLTFTLSHAVGWQQSPSECDGSSYLLMGGFVASP